MKSFFIHPKSILLPLLVALFYHSPKTLGQDLHFSQYYMNPMQLSPALTGWFDGDYRVSGIHRRQYSAIPVPYNTFSFAGDMRKNVSRIGSDAGLGILLNSDEAGDTRFTNRSFLISGSIIRKTGKDSTRFISLGLQSGFTFASVDQSKMTFDSQYNGDVYNPMAGSGENFNALNVAHPVLNAGLGFHQRFNERKSFDVVFSTFNINKPSRSLFNLNTPWLSPRINIYSTATKSVADFWDVMPDVVFSRQNKFWELVAGSRVRYWMAGDDGYFNALYFGLHYRVRDAIIPSVQMDYKNFRGGISYDITVSSLRKANNLRGGIELSLIYIFKKPVPFKVFKRNCPVFI
jgi:type IX secretion system PorP/SprF family membrane protein